MIWFILAIIFGILVIYIIHDEGIGWFTSIAGGLFCGAVGWFLCFVLAGAIASGIGNVTNSIKYVANPKTTLLHCKIIFMQLASEMRMAI